MRRAYHHHAVGCMRSRSTSRVVGEVRLEVPIGAVGVGPDHACFRTLDHTGVPVVAGCPQLADADEVIDAQIIAGRGCDACGGKQQGGGDHPCGRVSHVPITNRLEPVWTSSFSVHSYILRQSFIKSYS